MTSYKNPLMYGGGVMDTLMNAFTYSKYPGEHHYPYYAYLGPGSRLDIRLDENMKPRPREEPKDDLDAKAALPHDIAYQKIQEQYRRDGDKQKALTAVKKADDEFIKEASKSSVQPLGKISAGLIKAIRRVHEYNIHKNFQWFRC